MMWNQLWLLRSWYYTVIEYSYSMYILCPVFVRTVRKNFVVRTGHMLFMICIYLISSAGTIYFCRLCTICAFFFTGMFIMISGICCHLSRSNLKRGIKTFAVPPAAGQKHLIRAATLYIHYPFHRRWYIRRHTFCFCRIANGLFCKAVLLAFYLFWLA